MQEHVAQLTTQAGETTMAWPGPSLESGRPFFGPANISTNARAFLDHGTGRLNMLDLPEDAIWCPLCQEPFVDLEVDTHILQIEACGHVFCELCLTAHVGRRREYCNVCPLDRSELYVRDYPISHPTDSEEEEDDDIQVEGQDDHDAAERGTLHEEVRLSDYEIEPQDLPSGLQRHVVGLQRTVLEFQDMVNRFQKLLAEKNDRDIILYDQEERTIALGHPRYGGGGESDIWET